MPLRQIIGIGQVSASFKINYIGIRSARKKWYRCITRKYQDDDYLPVKGFVVVGFVKTDEQCSFNVLALYQKIWSQVWEFHTGNSFLT